MPETLLVVEDDHPSCRLVAAIFKAEGMNVLTTHDGPAGLHAALTEEPDVILLDLGLPLLDGFEVLTKLKASIPNVPVVVLTGSSDTKKAVRAIQLGAFDYLTKPISRDELVVVVKRALETRALRAEVQELRRHVGRGSGGTLASRMGPSARVRQIVEQVETVAASNLTVLVLGETGTGKELVADAIHQLSDRRARPLVALDCGAIPEPLLESELFGYEKGAFTGAERRKEGRLRLAERGTCFLDEVGNLAMNLQAKLLRVLESREVQPVGGDRGTPLDVRFVAATNHDLQTRVGQGLFRADLYFRLAQYTIVLPPLRERAEDIPYLTHRVLEEASIELRRPVLTIVPEALDLLRQHSWPGNVRELRNVLRQALLHANGLAIRASDVSAALTRPEAAALPAPVPRRGDSLREIALNAAEAAERDAICDTLRTTAGNKSQAARALKTDYKTLHLKMKHLGIRAKDYTG
jgi:two-component system, NtrC family, response regulator HydG